MPITVKASSGNQTALGLYLFKLTDVTEDQGKDFKTGKPVDQYKFIWEIERSLEAEPTEDQEAAIGTEYWDWTRTVASPASKLRARIEAVLGRDMKPDEDVDLESFIGRRIRATVAEDTLSDGRKYVTLITVPYKPRGGRAAKPATVEEDAELEPDVQPF